MATKQLGFSVSDGFEEAIKAKVPGNHTVSEYLREVIANAIGYDLSSDPVKPRGRQSEWPTPEHGQAFNVLKQRLAEQYTKDCLAAIRAAGTNVKAQAEAANTLQERMNNLDTEARNGVEAELVALRERKAKRDAKKNGATAS